MHRVLTDCPNDMVPDHKDGNGLNNRRNNLRICTIAENNQNQVNMKSNNKSGIRNVCWDSSRNKWLVSVKQKYIGRYDNIDDAHKAAEKARKTLMPFSTN